MPRNPHKRKTQEAPPTSSLRVARRRRRDTAPGEEADYQVGYGKPPKHSQFKAGQSGNPNGRPKGAKGMKSFIAKALDEKITYRSGEQEKRISVREGIAIRLREKALKGDHNAIKMLLSLDEQFELIGEFAKDEMTHPEDRNALDQLILDEYERVIREEADQQSQSSSKKRKPRS